MLRSASLVGGSVILSFVLACGVRSPGSDDAPPSGASPPASAPTSAPASLVAPPTSAPASTADQASVERVRELGKRRAAELAWPPRPDPSTDEITAYAACTRPSASDKKAIQAQVIDWVNRANPKEIGDPDSEVGVVYGCVEKNGIVLDVQSDRDLKSDPHRHVGRWWTVRKKDAAFQVLAQVSGTATIDAMEWASEPSMGTLALIDLDHDGLLDVISRHTEHEGGAILSDFAFSAITSANGKTTQLGSFSGNFDLVTGDAGTVVIRVRETHDDKLAFYRCLDGATLARCPASHAARRRDHALDVAGKLARGELFLQDRDQAAEVLDLLDVPDGERAPYLAGVAATTPRDRAARHIAAFLTPPADADKDEAEKHADRVARIEPYLATLRTALGDTTCPKGVTLGKPAEANLRAWVAANQAQIPCAPNARCAGKVSVKVTHLEVACSGPTSTYALVDWERSGAVLDDAHRSLFLVQHDNPLLVFDAPSLPADAQGGPPGLTPGFDGVYAIHGPAVTALIMDLAGGDTARVLHGFIDGKDAGKLPVPNAQIYGEEDDPFDSLVTSDSPSAHSIYHVGDKLTVVATFDPYALPATPPADPVARLLVEAVERKDARDFLTYHEPTQLVDPTYRDDTLRALAAIGADASLIDEVKRL